MRSLQLPVSRAPRRSRPRRVLLPAGAPRAASAAPAAAAAPTMLFALREAPAVSLAKSSLLSAIAGLDRGAAATPSDVAAVDAAIAALEAAGAAEEASAAPLDTRLAGKWRLVYSSTFAGVQAGSQGFRGPPGGGTPVRLGPVYQRIQPNAQRLDNILELVVPGPFFIGSLTVTATLSHLMRVTGERSIRSACDTQRKKNSLFSICPHHSLTHLDVTVYSTRSRFYEGHAPHARAEGRAPGDAAVASESARLGGRCAA